MSIETEKLIRVKHKKAKRLLYPVFPEMKKIVSGLFKNHLEKSGRIIYQ